MDARLLKLALLLTVFSSMGATFQTPNFVVNAPDSNTAKKVAQTAERCRDELAVEWLGRKLPRWGKPCQVTVQVGQIGAGGATTFAFDRGEVFGWKMRVQGTLERVLDSVVPHEVSHTIFACHFRRPLPRWADEGAATLVEHESERRRQHLTLKQVFDTPRRIPLKKLLVMTEYPSDMQDVLTLYAQGYSLADFLVQLGGKKTYLEFLSDAHKKNWDFALKKHYKFGGISDLEQDWTDWVHKGSPDVAPQDEPQLAQAQSNSNVVFRSQAPEGDESKTAPRQPARAAQRGDGLVAPEMHASNDESQPRVNERGNRASRDRANPKPAKSALGDDPFVANDNADKSADNGRLPRPRPLVLRQSLSKSQAGPSSDEERLPRQTESRKHSLSLPTTDDSEFEIQDHPAEEQELSSSRFPDWSDFPRHQTRDGSPRLENASGISDSP